MKRLACVLLVLLSTAASAGPPSASPLGRWVTASGNLEVEIAPCGDQLCGTVVDVLAHRSMSRSGEAMKPADPRDPMGMQVLHGFVATEFEGDGAARVPTRWDGRIYNRENARTYRAIMRMGESGELVLRGYVGLPLFGSTQTWQRASSHVAR
jgi:uncharacterized protein (DUF2147 family)